MIIKYFTLHTFTQSYTEILLTCSYHRSAMGCICFVRLPVCRRVYRGKVRKPRPWAHTEPITRAELDRMREKFWDTQPHYGGTREIWDVLHACAESPKLSIAQTLIDAAGIYHRFADLTVCYDETGVRYELPLYVLSEPTNLIPDNK